MRKCKTMHFDLFFDKDDIANLQKIRDIAFAEGFESSFVDSIISRMEIINYPMAKNKTSGEKK